MLDVRLRADGSVEDASVIEGEPVLADAAMSAVKQWRYRPLLVKGEPVLKFLVLLSFNKHGTVSTTR